MNVTEDKLYHINKQISLNALGLTFVHFKKLMKMQFLKYGKIIDPIDIPGPYILTVAAG